jgi:hypothetical protein
MSSTARMVHRVTITTSTTDDMDWKKEFAKIHYEPVHESGELCWCFPIKKVINGVYHIEHQEQRKILSDFIEKLINKP